MRFIENPDDWRVSISGYSIETGYKDESGRIVASYHCPHEIPVNNERFKKWLEDAELICELHNKWLRRTESM